MKFVTLAITLFISIILLAQPVITSFAPLSSTAGSTVALKEMRPSADACQKEFANHFMLLEEEMLLVLNDKEKRLSSKLRGVEQWT